MSKRLPIGTKVVIPFGYDFEAARVIGHKGRQVVVELHVGGYCVRVRPRRHVYPIEPCDG